MTGKGDVLAVRGKERGRSFTVENVKAPIEFTAKNIRHKLCEDRRRSPRPPRVSVVIPAKNEARNLEVILPELPRVHEVILVDGQSVDSTPETAQRVMPSIRVVSQSRIGKGNALACGFTAATGDIIVMFDADGSADPAEIPRFVEALAAGADFAKGSRRLEGGGSQDITHVRSAGNRALSGLTNALFGTTFTDLCYGYNAFWRDILEDLNLPPIDLQTVNPSKMALNGMAWGDGFEIETLLNCRVAAAPLTVIEVPSVEKDRIHGVSNLNAFNDGMRVLRTILVERHRKALADRRANVRWARLKPSASKVAG
jgi:glycosyltransferase involved in cell wall biosynthesis